MNTHTLLSSVLPLTSRKGTKLPSVSQSGKETMTAGENEALRSTARSNQHASESQQGNTTIDTDARRERGYKVFSKELNISISKREQFADFQSGFREYAPARVPGPSEVANTIFGFVENRLNQEAESGADADRLAELVAQARSGVNEGYGKAREQLAAMGLMDDALEEEIDQGYSILQDKLNGVDRTFAQPVANLSESGRMGQSPVQASAVAREHTTIRPPAFENLTSLSLRENVHESIGFNVRTKDGDMVRLNFSSAAKSGMDANSSNQNFALRGFSGEQFDFSISVDGDLDSNEIAALNDMLSQAADVATSFFQGDLGSAFDQALGFTMGDTLGSMDLSMTQTVSRSALVYERVAGLPSQGERALSSSNMVAGLQKMQALIRSGLESAKAFDAPAELLKHSITTALNIADKSEPFSRQKDAIERIEAFQRTMLGLIDKIAQSDD